MTERTKEEIRYIIEEGIKSGEQTLKLESRGECISAAEICVEELEKINKMLDEAFPGMVCN